MKGRKLAILFGIAVILIAIGWAVYLHIVKGYVWADWTGLSSYIDGDGKFQRGKTLWDWLELLIIPAVLAIGVWFFNQQERKNELKIAEERRKSDQEIADRRNQETILQNYFDKMNDLILEDHLMDVKRCREQAVTEGNSDLSEEEIEKQLSYDLRAVRDMAQVRTITALRQLDSERRNIIFQFLRDADLASFVLVSAHLNKATLEQSNMSGINLRGANLSEANLNGADLSKAKLSSSIMLKADLSKTILLWADLNRAYLINADLRFANLCGANLSGAILLFARLGNAQMIRTNLREADLTKADLSDAVLIKANLSGAKLRGATLKKANLNGGDLNGANLNRSNLTGAILTGADLRNADLSETVLAFADLSKVDLSGAKVSRTMLKAAKSIEGAILPDKDLAVESEVAEQADVDT